MGNLEQTKKELSVVSVFNQKTVQERFAQLLGEKAQGFITSVLQVTQNNKLLKVANPQSVLNAAATAAALDLPINQNLGYAWIVPYKGEAQFQMGWKGYVQLALRTGEYQRINAIPVYGNQFKSWNAMTENLEADFNIEGSGNAVGYVAYFRLNNGLEKTVYWSREKVEQHATKYSQSYKGGFNSPWKTDFDDMALKTVLKHTLSKWGILSIEMQTAVISDQSVQKKEGEYQYSDNQTLDVEELNHKEEVRRAKEFIGKAVTVDDLQQIKDSVPKNVMEDIQLDFNNKVQELMEGGEEV